jgi:hypothetical protein
VCQEFEHISVPGYHLTKVREFYMLTVDRAHANNLLHAQALKSALSSLENKVSRISVVVVVVVVNVVVVVVIVVVFIIIILLLIIIVYY